MAWLGRVPVVERIVHPFLYAGLPVVQGGAAFETTLFPTVGGLPNIWRPRIWIMTAEGRESSSNPLAVDHRTPSIFFPAFGLQFRGLQMKGDGAFGCVDLSEI